jgi:hypothetical protein
MRERAAWAVFMVLASCGAPRVAAQSGATATSAEAAPSPEERSARWRQDLELVRTEFERPGYAVDLQRGISTRGQKDVAKLYPELDKTIASIESSVPTASDAEIILRLMRLIASAHVAHNTVSVPFRTEGFWESLPVGFFWFPDGMAVAEALPDYGNTNGARVISIGGKTPEQVLALVSPYISYENEFQLRLQSSPVIGTSAVLQDVGLLDSEGKVSLVLQKAGEAPFTVRMAPGPPQVLKRAWYVDALHVPMPLFLSNMEKVYWYRYLADSQTLYIQYNRCKNDPAKSFADFSREALAVADAHPVKRVVIDLRMNGGGDSRVINPLKDGLAARRKDTGPVYVLIDSGTFSSAVDNAKDLRQQLEAKLVGEPTGGEPGGYGEVKSITLPNSKLVVTYTSKHWGSDEETPVTLQPDIPAPRNLADALAGSDPALDVAIRDGR